MANHEELKCPSKEEQKVALDSYDPLKAVINQIASDNPEIEIEETGDKIRIPLKALKFLAEILKATGEGKIVSIVPIATEMTTQAAADLLGCSRPHVVKLLENNEIPFTKVGRHRRIKYEDIVAYQQKRKEEQEALLIKMMKADEELGLYGS